jgi:serine/threonine protein kinase
MSLAPGTRIGAYEIRDSLGAGGMGEVYRARDTRLNRDVAIKVLPEALANDPERLQRLQREAQVLASLNHPNIAIVHGFEEGPAPAGHYPNAPGDGARRRADAQRLFEYRYPRASQPPNFQVAPDGRFLVVKPTTRARPAITVVTNWAQTLR